jgi:hypothetical protein
MIKRDLTPATQIVRNAFSEAISLRLLGAAVASDPKNAVTLIVSISDDLKAGVGEYIALAKASRDPKSVRGAEALQAALDAMVAQIEALKPKA